jgi:hypothetical protein
VKWPSACPDVSPGAEERPLLEDGIKQSSEDPENTSLCVKVICKV